MNICDGVTRPQFGRVMTRLVRTVSLTVADSAPYVENPGPSLCVLQQMQGSRLLLGDSRRLRRVRRGVLHPVPITSVYPMTRTIHICAEGF